MINEEVYIEESNPHKVKITIIIILVLLSVFFIVFLFLKSRYTLTIDKVIVEVGDALPKDISEYVENKVVDESDYKLYLDNIPLDKNGKTTDIGEYTYRVKYKSITKKGTIVVQDTKVPDVEVRDLTVGVGEDYDIADFVVDCFDYSKPVNITYKKESDQNLHKKAGIYEFKIVATDQAGNKIDKNVRLIVKKGYSYEDSKSKDMTVSYVDTDYKDWNNEYMIKFSKGVHEHELDHNEKYEDLMELSSDDMDLYLPEDKNMFVVMEQELIYIYNKYDYIIGIAVRVKLSNGEYIYLSK